MKAKNIILTALWAGLVVFGAILWFLALKKNETPTAKKEPPKVVVYKSKDSTTHARIEVKPVVVRDGQSAVNSKRIDDLQIASKEYEAYVKDTLAVALDIAVSKINELTRIKAKLEGELKATRVELAENKEKRVYYEDRYLSIVTQEDSTGSPQKLNYAYNAELNIANFSQRKNFWNKERHYIDVSSPDKNFKIYGLEHYKKEIYIRPKSVGIGLQFGYGITDDFRISPYMGVGVSYNLIRF